ncbi:DMT family transporter [Zophobihabitans entericus]|uniref:DMT family transporter n=1 Tax=Zophobihabitans entericus TaxID=1635327 RepID=A0A6G9I8P2_9GAMM|nr:DMT family transporter [Zophobihabitans entericus]QIQ20588.1 DMT family transporter [Zophobihabitans entericus]
MQNQSSSIFINSKFVFFGATLCCILWGSAYPAIKNGYELFHIAADDIPGKLVFAGYRFLFAGLLLLLFAKIVNKSSLSLPRSMYPRVALLGLTQTALQYTFFYLGLAYTTGTKGSILNATTTFFSVLLAHYLYKNDRLSMNKTVGCLIGFLGVMIVNIDPAHFDFSFTLIGEGSVILAAFILSAAAIYGKKLSQSVDSVVLTGYQLGLGGLILGVVGYLFGGTLAGLTMTSFLLMVYLVLLSSVAFALWTVLLKYNRVSVIAPFNFLVPISGVVLSAMFLNENIFAWKNLIALVCVCAGIWLANKVSDKATK